MKEIITIPASEVRAGDDVKTTEGFLNVGGAEPILDPPGTGRRIGLFTPKGLIGVDADDILTVRRDVAEQGT